MSEAAEACGVCLRTRAAHTPEMWGSCERERERRAKPEPFSVLMARSMRADAGASRALGCLLLGAELGGDWSRVAQVRAALVESALTLEAAAERLDAER